MRSLWNNNNNTGNNNNNNNNTNNNNDTAFTIAQDDNFFSLPSVSNIDLNSCNSYNNKTTNK